MKSTTSIDGIKTNNSAVNLEYVTSHSNHLHASALGLMPRGERHGHAKLDQSAILAIRHSESSAEELAGQYDVHPETIREIWRGGSWRHVGGPTTKRRPKPSLSIETIRAIHASTESTRTLAQRYGTSHETVRQIKAGRRWSDLL